MHKKIIERGFKIMADYYDGVSREEDKRVALADKMESEADDWFDNLMDETKIELIEDW